MISELKQTDWRTSYRPLMMLMGLLAFALLATGAFAQDAEMQLLNNHHQLRIGDRMIYSVAEEREQRIKIYVDSAGEVEIPYIGKVYGYGKTCRQLAYDIREILEMDFFHQATVNISRNIDRNTRGELTILGEIHKQGKHSIPADKIFYVSDTIIEAGGGFLPTANRREVIVIRKDPNNPEQELRITIDVGGVLETGQYEGFDLPVEPDDTIIVRKLLNVGGQYYITGEIMSPGLYNIPQGQKYTVSRAILVAGGFTEWAKRSKVKLIRADPNLNEKERTLIVNVDDILNHNIRDSDPIIQADDIIKVMESTFKF